MPIYYIGMIEQFDYYTKKLGWKIIPVYFKSKIPIGKNWNKNYNSEFARKQFKKNKDLNFGLLLGNIVDVEGDTEEANQYLNNILKDIPHPKYKSNKSVHHLFLNFNKNLTARRFKGIEFRGHRHQSIIPPSVHKNDVKYEWISFNETMPPMPQNLLNVLNRSHKIRANGKTKKKSHCFPWCIYCNKQVPIHKKRYTLEIEAFKLFGLKWQCQKCREIDVRQTCKKLRKNFLP